MKDKKNTTDWPLVGNSHIIDFLSASIAKDKIGGAYIFSGPEDLGKTTVAFYLAKSLLCQEAGNAESFCGHCSTCKQFEAKNEPNESSQEEFEIAHGDFHLIKKENDKKNISIEQIKEFITSLSMTSFLDSYKVGIIKNAEILSIKAANALLKTLEEPKKEVVIILITSDIEALPSTIASRSQVLRFHEVEKDVIYDYLINKHKASRSKAKNLSRLCLGRPALAVKLFEDNDFFNEYNEKINTSLGLFKKGINSRLEDIGNLVGTGQKQGARQDAYKILEIWQGIIRDMMLLHLGHNDLIQYEVVNKELYSLKDKYNIRKLHNINNSLELGRAYLRANVNPRLILENVMINL